MNENLQIAWTERLRLIADAKVEVALAKNLDKDRFPSSKNSKIAVWGASMESYYASEVARSKANALFLKADTGWVEAVIKERGNVRAEWSDGVSGWNCKLETGEEFLS